MDLMEETQFEIGQLVVYANNGICTVEKIEVMSFTAGMPKELYYVLRQKKNSATQFFVPVKNEKLTSKLRPLMQKEDIDDILMGLTDGDAVEWIPDRRQRTEYFKSILFEGVSGKLLNMIICIYNRKRQLDREGKKLPVTECTTLKSAERLVQEEFEFVLGLEAEEVPKYIRKRLHIQEDYNE